MYLVFNPARWTFAELGDFMYSHLLRDAAELGAKSLALVEYANDEPFLTFLRERGFGQVGEAVYNGFAIVRLEKRL